MTHLCSQVLRLPRSRSLRLPSPSLQQSVASLYPKGFTPEVPLFNPSSIVDAPPGLCADCSYVVTLRVSSWHQCHRRTSPFRVRAHRPVYYTGTVVAVLNASFGVVAWTWFLVDPAAQVLAPSDPQSLVETQMKVRAGASGAFPPPLVSTSSSSDHPRAPRSPYDARIIPYTNRTLLITYACAGCAGFELAQLVLSAEPQPHGGLSNLRAWAAGVFTSDVEWVAGRNQVRPHLASYCVCGQKVRTGVALT